MAPRVRLDVSGAPRFSAAAVPACRCLDGFARAWWHWLGFFSCPPRSSWCGRVCLQRQFLLGDFVLDFKVLLSLN